MIADTAITETSLTGTPMAAAMITEAAQKLHKPLTLRHLTGNPGKSFRKT